MAKQPNDEVQLKLRFYEALRRRLEKEAAKNDRSMNAEIIHRLDRSFDPPPLDLYRMMQRALSQSQRYPEWAMAAMMHPLCAALEQLLPNLHSVQINLFEDATVRGNITHSEKGEQYEKLKIAENDKAMKDHGGERAPATKGKK